MRYSALQLLLLCQCIYSTFLLTLFYYIFIFKSHSSILAYFCMTFFFSNVYLLHRESERNAIWILCMCWIYGRTDNCLQWTALVELLIPDIVSVISWEFPAAALEQVAEARAWRLGLLIVSVISWLLLPPVISPELPMTWLRSWEPAESTGEKTHIS